MTNRQIAKIFQLLARMMELHGENEFRIRAYRNAYDALKKLERPVAEMSDEELTAIKGIGKSTSEKIRELLASGEMERFQQYAKKTPEGIREMLMVKGLGPSKVKAVWKGLGIESPGELLYACNENRLVELSGFGMKTQAEIRKQLEYHLESSGKFLWAALEPVADQIIKKLKAGLKGQVDWVGEYARKCPVVNMLEGVVEEQPDLQTALEGLGYTVKKENDLWHCAADEVYRFTLEQVPARDYTERKLLRTAGEVFLRDVRARELTPDAWKDIPPELMEGSETLENALNGAYETLIAESDLKGILHCHSTYSDGLHTLREMAEFTRDAGYAYLGITDHSRSAVYANGLSEERVQEQWAEIEALNKELAPFRVFRGIESDILADGSLDYPEDMLRLFDLIVASVHSGLKMDEDKATARIIKAVENPHTDILGHPTGRLLLARHGYPLNHHKVIDACAANGVAIELNANPQRLDMDATHIPYALEKGVLIAINPDAHSRDSIRNVRFGVYAARRGGLTREMCLNTKPLDAFVLWLEEKR